ncbi:MAG: peptidylprolyl isomerase [Desulfurococcaceae archaeon]
MTISEGDFILLEYTVYVKETGNVIDTTNEELAKKMNIYESGRIYGPQLIVIGKGWINKVVEEEIMKMSIGEERTIEVSPDKAYGPRDPGKVKVFSLRDFHRRGLTVTVGDVVEIGGVKGIVKSINGGRVTVDFNHPLAGKTLIYKAKLVAKLEDINDKLKHLASGHLRIPIDELEVIYDPQTKEVSFTIPSKYVSRGDLQYGKISLASDVLDFFKESIDKIVFKEVIARSKE